MTSPSHGEDLVFESRRAHIRLRLVCADDFFNTLKEESVLKKVFCTTGGKFCRSPPLSMPSGIRSGSRSHLGLPLTVSCIRISSTGDTIILIDTGVAGCENQIFEDIRSTGRDPSEIALVILTHSHPDHIGAARAIQQTYRVQYSGTPGRKDMD